MGVFVDGGEEQESLFDDGDDIGRFVRFEMKQNRSFDRLSFSFPFRIDRIQIREME